MTLKTLPALVFVIACLAAIFAIPVKAVAPVADQLLEKAEALHAALLDELDQLQNRHRKRQERVELFRSLFAEGLVSRLELSEVEDARESDGQLIARREAELTQVADLIAEVHLLASSKEETEPAMELYPGRSSWSLDEIPSLAIFFERSFGRPLPISARGQTHIHSRLGLDHRSGLDLAIHPSSREGEAMLAYLRELDIPHIAFGKAVPGGATGAHIHVGPQSVRLK